MQSQEIRKLARHCVSLRRRKDALGCQLDQLEAGAQQYAAADALYGKLFDQIWDMEDAILAAPVISKCDVAVKAKIIATRARLDVDLTPLLLKWQTALDAPPVRT